MDNHKIFLMVVVGGGGGAEGLGWDVPEVLSPIGCQDKFHHIVKKNVIGSARIARLCLYILFHVINLSLKLSYNVLIGC